MAFGPTPKTGQRPGASQQQQATVPTNTVPKSKPRPTPALQGGSAENDKRFDVQDEIQVREQTRKSRPKPKPVAEQPATRGDVMQVREILLQLMRMIQPVPQQMPVPQQALPPGPQQMPQPGGMPSMANRPPVGRMQ